MRGEVSQNGASLSGVPARLRNFGIVFQSYSLFPNMSVARNIGYGLECRKWPKDEIGPRIDEVLTLVHLRDQAHKYPHQLSGGQQQRVALARALAPNPTVLLLDEPLSALDAKVREELRAEIKDLQTALRVTTVMVTHDQHEAMEMADRIVVMHAGVIEQVGDAVDLYDQPVNRFVAEFIGRMNLVRLSTAKTFARGDDRRRRSLRWHPARTHRADRRRHGRRLLAGRPHRKVRLSRQLHAHHAERRRQATGAGVARPANRPRRRVTHSPYAFPPARSIDLQDATS